MSLVTSVVANCGLVEKTVNSEYIVSVFGSRKTFKTLGSQVRRKAAIGYKFTKAGLNALSLNFGYTMKNNPTVCYKLKDKNLATNADQLLAIPNAIAASEKGFADLGELPSDIKALHVFVVKGTGDTTDELELNYIES